MNISKINSANAAKIYTDAAKKANAADDKAGQGKKPWDAGAEKGGMNISREAKNLNVVDFAAERVKADLNNDDVSADRIAQLKNLINSGEYRVSTDALVSAVISGIGRA
jgi:anti-sigma28 factor (negative regulator of flagellin synthesis)